MALRETQIAATLIYSSVAARIEIGDELVVIDDRVVAVRAPVRDELERESPTQIDQPAQIVKTGDQVSKPESVSTAVWRMVMTVTKLLRESGETLSSYEISSRLGYNRQDVASRSTVSAALKYMFSHALVVKTSESRKPKYQLTSYD